MRHGLCIALLVLTCLSLLYLPLNLDGSSLSQDDVEVHRARLNIKCLDKGLDQNSFATAPLISSQLQPTYIGNSYALFLKASAFGCTHQFCLLICSNRKQKHGA